MFERDTMTMGAVVLALLLGVGQAVAAVRVARLEPGLVCNGYRVVTHRNGAPARYDYFPPGSPTIGQLQARISALCVVTCGPDLSLDASSPFDTNVWADATGAGAAVSTVESTFYADSTSLAVAGDVVVFSGLLASNTLVAPYSNSISVFIKDYSADFSVLRGSATVGLGGLTNGQVFNLSLGVGATGDHVQWGVVWTGPPARSSGAAALGLAAIAPVPLPRGAIVPWTTYEAEDMVGTGTVLGPGYGGHDAASESSGRRCVRLGATGSQVRFTVLSNANSLVLRYSVPDTADGVGADSTLGLYRNGSLAARLPLSSRYSWLYGDYPFTNSPAKGFRRNLFDEVRLGGLTFNTGDVVVLQKDAVDTAAFYDIDLVDLEWVPPPLVAPSNSLSITAYGAVGDGVVDCTAALQSCLNAGATLGRAVWMPAGRYLVTGMVSLPPSTTLQGAGMWHTTLVGSEALYNAGATRRVNLTGTGSGIRLSDFAITGRLTYRNDTEGNDGLGGTFGTGSVLSRLWIEHTKAAAWLVNSSGLVVDGCRFRNTLADGINLCVGTRGCVVTNCTARGTGDDCFAVWPAGAAAQSYSPGLNLVTHCMGQTPFLGNGGALYGGEGNRIEDCQFSDITYGCGVLLSTTFPVSTNFGGRTSVRRCDLLRTGGTQLEPWAGLQISLLFRGISGLELSDLNLAGNVTHGLSVIYGGGALTDSRMSNVSIPDCGVGGAASQGLWARGDAIGSLSVSNCLVVGVRDDSPNFSFQFSGPAAQRILNMGFLGTMVTLTYATTPTFSYRVEWTASLAPANWVEVPGSRTNATAGAVTFTNPLSGGSRFFRIVSP